MNENDEKNSKNLKFCNCQLSVVVDTADSASERTVLTGHDSFQKFCSKYLASLSVCCVGKAPYGNFATSIEV